MAKENGIRIAVVTGASSGLGREFVKQISKEKAIDEIWVIARRKERLEELIKVSEKRIRAIPLDLTEKSAFEVLGHQLEEREARVQVLVNAAGMGKIAMSRDLSVAEHDRMIELNCRGPVDCTITVLPYMKKGSRIINICSVAGYQPLPGLNTYAASKAFLLSWTRALHQELLPKGIRVTALCPYWIKDTEFIPLARETGKESIKRFVGAGHSKAAVAAALRGSKANFTTVSPGPVAKGARLISWVLPDWVEVPLLDLIRRI